MVQHYKATVDRRHLIPSSFDDDKIPSLPQRFGAAGSSPAICVVGLLFKDYSRNANRLVVMIENCCSVNRIRSIRSIRSAFWV